MAKVLVAGAGAIGGIVAARMALAGHQVGVIARGEHLKAIQRDGLTLDDQLARQRHCVQVQASSSAADFTPPDLLVIGVKAPALAGLLPTLKPLIGPETIVVPALNGLPWWYFQQAGGAFAGRRIECLDKDGSLTAAVNPAQIVGAVVYIAGEVATPGIVSHTANRRIVIGDPAGPATGAAAERLTRLAGWWRDSGIEAEIADDIRFAIWSKLLGNLSFNPVAALTGCRTDEMIADEGLCEILAAMIDEARAVAAALGIEGLVTARARIDQARSIGGARASTLQDIEARRRPEIEGLIGSVIEVAGWVGVPVPTIRQIAALLTARARTLGLLNG